jgi:hypothetical protein
MAVINPPAWMQAGSYPARTDRLVVSSLLSYPGFLVDEATPMRVRQGVRPSYTNQQLKARAASTPNMTVLVSAGMAYIDNHDAGGSGTYVCVNDADVTLTIAPSGGAGQFRKDCVIASVYDAETAGSLSEWRLEVIQGTYAASAGAAVRPSLPPNAQIIADVAVGASVTSIAAGNITDVRQFSVSLGGALPVSSASTPNRPHPGQLLYQTNTDIWLYGKQDGSTGTLVPKATAWTAITLAGTWAPNAGTGDSVPAARITHDGTLELAGMAKGVAIAIGSNASFGTIPAALLSQLSLWVRGVAASSVAQNYVRVAVDPASGAISLVNGSVAITSTAWIQLDGVRGRIA